MTPGRSYFTRLGPNEHLPGRWCMGAWNTEELHVAPVNGLLMHEYEHWSAGREPDGLVAGSIRFDYLGVIDFTPCTVTWRVVRPGRAVELIEGVVEQHGRPVLRALMWRLATAPTEIVAGGAPDRLPPPDGCQAFDATAIWRGEYIGSLEFRSVTAGEPGDGVRWVRSPIEHVVAVEPSSPFTRWVLLADTCNGIAVRESPDEWQFPNLDLAVHLIRQPTGPWLGARVHVTFGPGGHGLTEAALYDLDGYVGSGTLGLLVRPQPNQPAT